MKRKKASIWAAVQGDVVTETSNHRAALNWDDVRLLVEADPLVPLYKRVALAAVGYFLTRKYKQGTALRLDRAMAALQKARRARR